MQQEINGTQVGQSISKTNCWAAKKLVNQKRGQQPASQELVLNPKTGDIILLVGLKIEQTYDLFNFPQVDYDKMTLIAM